MEVKSLYYHWNHEIFESKATVKCFKHMHSIQKLQVFSCILVGLICDYKTNLISHKFDQLQDNYRLRYKWNLVLDANFEDLHQINFAHLLIFDRLTKIAEISSAH